MFALKTSSGVILTTLAKFKYVVGSNASDYEHRENNSNILPTNLKHFFSTIPPLSPQNIEGCLVL